MTMVLKLNSHKNKQFTHFSFELIKFFEMGNQTALRVLRVDLKSEWWVCVLLLLPLSAVF